MLLWGPPGCGKTRLAAATAATAGVPLFVLNGPDVVSAFYGHSEAGLRVTLSTCSVSAVHADDASVNQEQDLCHSCSAYDAFGIRV